MALPFRCFYFTEQAYKAFEGSREDILNSIRLSKRYLDNFLI